MPRRIADVLLLHIAICITVFAPTTAGAAPVVRNGEAIIASCTIAGQDRVASISLAGTQAIYRYGRQDHPSELTLSIPLADLDYQRESGRGETISEIATFVNGDTAYRFAAGFKDGLAPDPSALQPFGHLAVMRDSKILARLICEPSTIQRVPDQLLARMREIGRKTTSDGAAFPNYPIHPPVRAAQSPACEADSNVDTCWSRGVSAARSGDLRAALEHYDQSCDAGIGTMGCYEAGKLYLQNRQLRNYPRAQQRLSRTCNGNDAGQGPYACKYLGWMSFSGIGAPRNLKQAFDTLAKACFLHNDAVLIDPEGCHFLAQTVLELRRLAQLDDGSAHYLAYLALAQGCTDDAKTLCDEGQALYQREAARSAAWIRRCDSAAGHRGPIMSCAALAASKQDYDAAQAARQQLLALFRNGSAAVH